MIFQTRADENSVERDLKKLKEAELLMRFQDLICVEVAKKSRLKPESNRIHFGRQR